MKPITKTTSVTAELTAATPAALKRIDGQRPFLPFGVCDVSRDTINPSLSAVLDRALIDKLSLLSRQRIECVGKRVVIEVFNGVVDLLTVWWRSFFVITTAAMVAIVMTNLLPWPTERISGDCCEKQYQRHDQADNHATAFRHDLYPPANQCSTSAA